MLAALLIACLSTVYLAGASVYRIATNQGELIIETDDPNIEVTIRGKGEQVTVLDLVTSKKIELKAGEYQLQLGKDAQDLALSTDQFQLTRGGKKVVEIRRIAAAHAELQFRTTTGTVELRRNGKVVESLTAAKKLRLPPGEYTIALAGMPEGLDWQPKSFSLQPGESRSVALSIFGVVRSMDSHGGTISAMAATTSGLALSASSDRTMSLWDVKTGEERKRFPFAKSPIHTCDISADGKWAVSAAAKSATPDLAITLWDIEQTRAAGTFTGHTNWVTALAFTPDGQHILSASQDGTVIEWDRTTMQKVRTWTAHAEGVNCLAIGPNGQFVTGGSDHRVRFWDRTQPKLLAEFVGHSDSVRAVAISPDGTHVLSGGLDRTVRLWQTAKPSLVHTFTGHEGWVNAVAWTPQGTQFLSAASDKTVRLWDVAAKSDPLRLEGHTAGVQCLLVMPQGSHAISAGHDKSIRVWQLP